MAHIVPTRNPEPHEGQHVTKLHQVIPAVEGVSKKAQTRLTEMHQVLAKDGLLSGQTRTYQPDNDDGDRLPPQGQIVQVRVVDVIATVRDELADWIDVALTRDEGNMTARADIVIDGQVIAAGVPATTLLWLEKRADDLHTFVSKFPTLATDERWEYDDNDRVWRAQPVESVKTTKAHEVIILAPATDKHPAQTQLAQVDRREGVWTTTKLSGAVPQTTVRTLVDRVTKLRAAVKAARAAANETEVEQKHVGAAILDYVFADVRPTPATADA